MTFNEAVENVGKFVDAVGVAVIVVGIITAAVMSLRHPPYDSTDFRRFRQRVGRAILLGLELLVAADIIRTVAVTPTFRSAGVAGDHRRDPHLPELQPRGGTRGAMALAAWSANSSAARASLTVELIFSATTRWRHRPHGGTARSSRNFFRPGAGDTADVDFVEPAASGRVRVPRSGPI